MDEKKATSLSLPAQPLFTVFPNLPVELRLKIWGLASQTQRVLELNYAIVDQEFYTHQSPPSVLHTNCESREVGLHYYHLSFSTEKQQAAIYFNPINDIIYFGNRQYSDEISYMIEHFAKQTAPHERILNLAISEHLWHTSDPIRGPFAFDILRQWGFERSLTRFLECFPHLQQLIFVKGQCTGWSAEDDVCLESACEDYSGITLVTATPGGWMEGLSKEIVRAVGRILRFIETKEKSHATSPVPKFTVMEYDLSLKQHHPGHCADAGC